MERLREIVLELKAASAADSDRRAAEPLVVPDWIIEAMGLEIDDKRYTREVRVATYGSSHLDDVWRALQSRGDILIATVGTVRPLSVDALRDLASGVQIKLGDRIVDEAWPTDEPTGNRRARRASRAKERTKP